MAELTGRKAAVVYRAVYGSGEQWIGWDGPELDASWVRKTPFPDYPVRGSFNDPLLQRAACLEGLGISLLPCVVADPYLPRISEPEPAYDIWVLVHPDLKRNPRLRVFRDFIVERLRGHRPALQGCPKN